MAEGLAFADDPNVKQFAGEITRLQRICHIVEIDRIDALNAGDFVEVEVVCDDSATHAFGESDQPLIHGQFGQVLVLDIIHSNIDLRVLLQLRQHIESATPANPPQLVVAVGDRLQFFQNKAGDDQLGVENVRVHDVGDPSINQRTRIHDQWTAPFDFLREFHVRNHETEVVLGLQEERNADVRQHHTKHDANHGCHSWIETGRCQKRLKRVIELVGEQPANQHSKVHGRDDIDSLPRKQNVSQSDHLRSQHHHDEGDGRIRLDELWRGTRRLNDGKHRPGTNHGVKNSNHNQQHGRPIPYSAGVTSIKLTETSDHPRP